MPYLDDTGVEYLVGDIKEKTDAAYQAKLVSGTNIKTVNGNSLLGSGDLAVSGLPSVTASDNGKFLRVVNGAWVADTVPNANGVSF